MWSTDQNGIALSPPVPKVKLRESTQSTSSFGIGGSLADRNVDWLDDFVIDPNDPRNNMIIDARNQAQSRFRGTGADFFRLSDIDPSDAMHFFSGEFEVAET